jgi:hypothetical protein
MEEEGIEIYGFSEKPEVPHAILRAKERYNIDLTTDDLQKISEICQSKTWRRDYQKNLGFGKHHIHVNYKDVWLNLIYSDTTKYIVTILHPKSDPKSKDI